MSFNKGEISHNFKKVVEYQCDHSDVPDTIDYGDYSYSQEEYCNVLRADSDPVRGLELFPYPKASKHDMRWLAVLDLGDMVKYTAGCARIAAVTDPLLSPRVFSYRLRKKPPFWELRSYKAAYRKYIQEAIRLCCESNLALCATDISSYFPSVSPVLIEDFLLQLGCDPYATRMIAALLNHWHYGSDLRGLPIGPDASRVLGNAFLKPLDEALEKSRGKHIRYMDDILLFDETTDKCAALLAKTKKEIEDLELRLSDEKTEFFETRASARDFLKDRMITSLDSAAKSPTGGSLEVRRAFDKHIRDNLGVDRRQYRWIVKFLKNSKDPYGALALAKRPELMNIDPKLSGSYIAQFVRSDEGLKDYVMRRLSTQREDRFDALDLHLLKAMTKAGDLGAAEGAEFFQIANETAQRTPIRCWAWEAYGRCSSFRSSDAEDLLLEEESSEVRRAALASRRHSTDANTRTEKNFLNHVSRSFRDLRYTTRWLKAA